MTASVSELAERYGIEASYISERGDLRIVSDDVKRALLDAMEVGEEARAPQASAPPDTVRCFMPAWLEHERAWGLSLQLYGVRSTRNLGIGDFEDLARLAEMFAAWGADFIGANPLHALFAADPERASPYSPSSRQYLNPIYIAADRLLPLADAPHSRAETLRATDRVDYSGVWNLKRTMLEAAFEAGTDDTRFDTFCRVEGEPLQRFATFEALSERFAAAGLGAGWHGWPEAMRDPSSREVAEFAARHGDRIRFHKWLQWVAATQLADAHERALAAGMRIGVYLDLAVGVAPDGAAAWSDRALFAAHARIGAPPDLFNHAGQDWGLAPMKPANLLARDLEPFEREIAAVMKSVGAIRLDHAMSLTRLYWLPATADACHGGYVRYPMEQLLAVLGRCSQAARCVVVGEDLGTVPPDFREVMRAHGLLGYRVLYFERGANSAFAPPERYPKDALACIATHDLPTLSGWWQGRDIEARLACGRYESEQAVADARRERAEARARLLAALREAGGLEGEQEADAPVLPDDVFVAAHRYLARTPCRLCAVQLEDLAGAVDMVNLPGTDREHPNWRRKLPVTIEQLPELDALQRTVAAVAMERRRRS